MNIALRPFCVADAHELYTMIAFNQQHLSTFKWATNPSIQATTDFILDRCLLSETSDVWAIEVDGAIAGCIEIRDVGDVDQIGYWLAKDYTGQGIMATAVLSVTQCLARPVIGRTWRNNKPSQATLVRCGFKQTTSDERWINFRKDPA